MSSVISSATLLIQAALYHNGSLCLHNDRNVLNKDFCRYLCDIECVQTIMMIPRNGSISAETEFDAFPMNKINE